MHGAFSNSSCGGEDCSQGVFVKNPKRVTHPENVTTQTSTGLYVFQKGKLIRNSYLHSDTPMFCKFEGCWSFVHELQVSESCRLAKRREDWKRPWSLFSTLRLLIKLWAPVWRKKKEHNNLTFLTVSSFTYGISTARRWPHRSTMQLLKAERWKISVVCTLRLGRRNGITSSNHTSADSFNR